MQYHHKKSLSLPRRNPPDSSHSHPRRSPSKASAYLPASPPSYPEESSQSLPVKKRVSPPPHFHPHQKKTPLYAPTSEPANTLPKQSPPPLPPHKGAYPDYQMIRSKPSLILLPLIPTETNKTSAEITRLSTRRQMPLFPEYFLPFGEASSSLPSVPPRTTLR